MKTYSFVIEKDSETGQYVGYIPGFAGAHSYGDTIEDLKSNLKEVIEMLLEDGEPQIESEFIGTEELSIA